MTEHNPCRIIGVLDNGSAGLSTEALAHVREAEVVIGGHRTLALFAEQLAPGAVQHDLSGKLSQVPVWIQTALEEGKRVVVLASGDPLCHGIGKYLLGKLGLEACEILPNVSTIQLACASFGRPWQDMRICSVHTRDTGEWFVGAGPEHSLYSLLQASNQFDSLAVFTSPENTPDRIARMLQLEGRAEQWRLSVAENLLSEREQLFPDLRVADAAGLQFAEPNVVLLQREASVTAPVRFGLADEAFQQRKPDKGLITKREVRAVSLARLQLRPDSVVWDIGAGSGSVGLEAARLCPRGHVYAVEKNVDDAAIALANRAALGVTNYSLINAKAPAGLADWPAPDAVFIGGSGGELAELILLCLARLKPGGWLVMNFVTLENLTSAIEALKASGVAWDATQLNAARSQPILSMQRMAAENPVWILSAQAGAAA